MQLSRRDFIRIASSAGLSALLPSLQAGASERGLIRRTIPASGERLPVVGIGTSRRWDFAQTPQAMAPARETLLKFLELGGTVLDTAPSYQRAEDVMGALLTELEVRELVFLSTKVRKEDPAEARAEMDASFRRMNTEFIELCSVHNFVGMDTSFDLLHEYREAGRYRYLGVTTHRTSQHADMIRALETRPLDFIQVNYSLASREAAERVLPLAMDRGVAVTINVPYARGALFDRVSGETLPAWAVDFDCHSWGQFFLKYIIAHPAVTVVIPGTSKLHHLVDNMGAGYGRLPDAAERRRMEQFIDRL